MTALTPKNLVLAGWLAGCILGIGIGLLLAGANPYLGLPFLLGGFVHALVVDKSIRSAASKQGSTQ